MSYPGSLNSSEWIWLKNIGAGTSQPEKGSQSILLSLCPTQLDSIHYIVSQSAPWDGEEVGGNEPFTPSNSTEQLLQPEFSFLWVSLDPCVPMGSGKQAWARLFPQVTFHRKRLPGEGMGAETPTLFTGEASTSQPLPRPVFHGRA